MSWTNTISWPTGTIITEARANAYLRDNLDYLKARADIASLPLLIEALEYDSVPQGAWLMAFSTSQYKAFYLFNNSNANGDSLVYNVLLKPGSYSVNALYYQQNINGVMAIDYSTNAGGAYTLAGTIDTYGASSVFNVQGSVSFTAAAAVDRLRVRVNGKNASSWGSYLQYTHLVVKAG